VLSLNGDRFDPMIEDLAEIKEKLSQLRFNHNLLLVDWTIRPLSPQKILQTYLPLVEFAHELGYRVQLRIPLVLMSRFSYDSDPIVFCGHTLNPFAFDQVDVILE